MNDDRQPRVEIPRPKYQHLCPPEAFEIPAQLASALEGKAPDVPERVIDFGELKSGRG